MKSRKLKVVELQPTDDLLPWERQPDETIRMFAYFEHYRDMPDATRNLRQCALELGLTYKSIRQISYYMDWGKRIKAHKDYLVRKRHETSLRKIEEMAERHNKHALAFELSLMTPVNEFAERLRTESKLFKKLTAPELMNMVLAAADRFTKIVDTERKSRGAATDITKQDVDYTSNGKGIEPVINVIVNGSKSNILKEINKKND